MQLKKSYDNQNRIVLIAIDHDGVEWARSLPKLYHSPASYMSLMLRACRLQAIYDCQIQIQMLANELAWHNIEKIKNLYVKEIRELASYKALMHRKTRQAIAQFKSAYYRAVSDRYDLDD